MNRASLRHATRDGAAVALLGLVALAIACGALLLAVPELSHLAHAAGLPAALAPL